MRLGLVVLWLVPAVALAQTPCTLANYGPNDGGWIGPTTRVDCTCSDCPLVRLEARLVTGAYGDSNSFDVTTPNATTPTYAGFTHLADYAWRATPLQGDGGTLPTSVEGFARADSRGPTDPVFQQVLVDGGLFSLIFTPSIDDGIGVDDYKGRFASADEPTVVAFGAGTSGGLLSSFLGPGDWMIGLYAKDRVDNLSTLVWWPTSIHTVASGLTVTDVAPAPGSYDYRVSAVDLAGNRGPPSNSATVVVVAFDAGTVSDAGAAADGGASLDAGAVSEGRGGYAVGCGCRTGGPWWAVARMALLFGRRRFVFRR